MSNPFFSSVATPPGGSGQFAPTTNGAGTLLSTARPNMASDPAVDLTDPARDFSTVCTYGNAAITIKTLLAMGVLKRVGAVLTENYSTLQGDAGSPKAFPA